MGTEEGKGAAIDASASDSDSPAARARQHGPFVGLFWRFHGSFLTATALPPERVNTGCGCCGARQCGSFCRALLAVSGLFSRTHVRRFEGTAVVGAIAAHAHHQPLRLQRSADGLAAVVCRGCTLYMCTHTHTHTHTHYNIHIYYVCVCVCVCVRVCVFIYIVYMYLFICVYIVYIDIST